MPICSWILLTVAAVCIVFGALFCYWGRGDLPLATSIGIFLLISAAISLYCAWGFAHKAKIDRKEKPGVVSISQNGIAQSRPTCFKWSRAFLLTTRSSCLILQKEYAACAGSFTFGITILGEEMNDMKTKRIPEAEDNFYIEGNAETPELLDSFFRNLGASDVLSRVRVIELSKQIIGRRNSKARDKARVELAEHNLKWVITLAKGFRGRGLDFPDLIQEGVVGLLRAVELFDHRKGFTFTTYSKWWIRQSILRAIVNYGQTIRVPVNTYDKRHKILDCAEALAKNLGRLPTYKEIAEHSGESMKTIKRIFRFAFPKLVYFDEPAPIDDAANEKGLHEIIADDKSPDPSESADRATLHDHLINLIEGLAPREKGIIKLRFGFCNGEKQTLEEVGKKYKVTRERIRQIQEKTLRKLRYWIRIRKLTSSGLVNE